MKHLILITIFCLPACGTENPARTYFKSLKSGMTCTLHTSKVIINRLDTTLSGSSYSAYVITPKLDIINVRINVLTNCK